MAGVRYVGSLSPMDCCGSKSDGRATPECSECCCYPLLCLSSRRGRTVPTVDMDTGYSVSWPLQHPNGLHSLNAVTLDLA